MRVFLTALLASSIALPHLAEASAAQPSSALGRAASLVDTYKDVVIYCAPCGDTVPGVPFRASGTSQALMRGTHGLKVRTNGRELDVRHTFVRTEPGWYRNLAVLVDLPSEGAPASLRVARSGTGEIISIPEQPQHARVEAAPPKLATISQAAGSPKESPREPTHPGLALLALLGLGLSSIASGGVLWLLFLMRGRRRRTTLPRALHLRE